MCYVEGVTEESGDLLRERPAEYGQEDLAPPDYIDPVIEAYKKDVDRTLLRENLKLTPQERSERFERAMELVWELRRVAAERRASGPE